MKKNIKILVSLMLCIAMFCTLALSAAADNGELLDKLNEQAKEIKDTKEKQKADSSGLIDTDQDVVDWWENGVFSAGKPSAEDIYATGDEIYIKMPHPSYYLDEYEYKYVNDGERGFSVFVFDNPDNGIESKYNMPRAYHGSKVIVLAVRQKHSCILYRTEHNVLRAGWVSSAALQDEFPGDVYSVGKKNTTADKKNMENFVPRVKWSEEPIADTYTKYTIVNNEGKKCTSITLDYQVIGRNSVAFPYGDREVYCFVDGEWIKAGEFTVAEDLDTVQYTIHFNKPVSVNAFLIFPENHDSQYCDTRQSVVEMCCPEE